MLIVDLWRSLPGKFFCVSTKSESGEWEDHFFSREELGEVRAFLREYSDHDLYWCPHGFSRKRRREDAAVLGPILYADLDEADPRHMNPKPTIAIESSPGRFVGLWLIDKPMTKELNRALTYHVGADHGGWDPGQVLRIPGTTNFKYDNEPRVRTLWDDGQQWTFGKIKDVVKRSLVVESAEASASDVTAIYDKYESKLPPWLRRELMRRDKPAEGKRSEMIWKIEHALIEAGCTTAESFALIKACVWNKFRGRANEDKQLKGELIKIRNEHFGETPATPDSEYSFFQSPIDDAEERNIDWIWRGRLARGEMTIVEGDPGLGKSYFVQMVCRHLCDGDALPGMTADERKHLTAGKVLYFDMENDQGAVTKPRLVDNGLRNRRNFYQEEGFFSIDIEDAKVAVEDAVERLRPAAIVFDTLNNYIGKADTHKSSEVQQAMSWFRELGRRYHCAVIVLRHLTKSSGKEKALYRGQGSIGFAGAARIILTVGVNPDDTDERVVAVSKMNLTKMPRSVTYRISSLPDTATRQDRSKFEWGDLCDLTADDILNVVKTSDDNAASDKAAQFLRDVLGDGPEDSAKVVRMAEARGISKRTLQRIADDLVSKTQRGFGKTSATIWELVNPEE